MNLTGVFYVHIMFLVGVSQAFGQTYVNLGLGRVSGDFDTGVNSSINTLSAEYGYYGSRFFASGTVSYLSLDTEGLDTRNGMGDTLLAAGYIYRSQDNELKLLPSVAVKVPTADEDDMLGSGETDVGMFLDVYKNCGGIVCTAGVGYIVVGDPPGIEYDNVSQLNVGGYMPFEKSGLSAYLQYESSVIAGRTDPLKLGINGFYLMNLETSFYIDGVFGLNETAPDYGIHTGIIRWF